MVEQTQIAASSRAARTLGRCLATFARNRAAAVAAGVLAVLVSLSRWPDRGSARYDLDQVDWTLAPLATPPSLANGHWFGTDGNGRDLFVRVWVGTRISLLVALLATLREPRDRRRLGRDGRLSRRPHRRLDDAFRRRAVRAAVHVLRDHPDGRLRSQPVADFPRDRRGRAGSRWRASCAARRSRCVSANSSRRRSRSACRRSGSSRGTSCPTCSAR